MVTERKERGPFNYHRTNTFGSNLEFEADTRAGVTSFGLEFRREGVVSTNLGEPLAEKVGEHYTNGLSRNHFNLYAEHSLNGSIIAMETGQAFAYALNNLQSRGRFFIAPGEEVYAGQVVGEHKTCLTRL